MIRARCAALHGLEPPLQPRVSAPATSATLPAVPLMLIGVGSTMSAEIDPPTAPASCTSTYPNGSTKPESSVVICVVLEPKLPVPVALAYCSDRPVNGTATGERLKISM